MQDIYISGTGVWTPPHKISNEELVTSFNSYVDLYNSENSKEIEAGSLKALEPSSTEFIVKASGIHNRYVIEKDDITVDIWEEKPSAGSVTYIELRGGEKAVRKELLQKFSTKLPRKPWEYTFGQKVRNGWLSQGILGAKKSWYKVIE